MHRKHVYRRLFDFTSILCLQYFCEKSFFRFFPHFLHLFSFAGFCVVALVVWIFVIFLSLLRRVCVRLSNSLKRGTSEVVWSYGRMYHRTKAPCPVPTRRCLVLFVLIELDVAAAVVQPLPRPVLFIVWKIFGRKLGKESNDDYSARSSEPDITASSDCFAFCTMGRYNVMQTVSHSYFFSFLRGN